MGPTPTQEPTRPPTEEPTHAPSHLPTAVPSPSPTRDPTAEPSPSPTHVPSAEPTPSPTLLPTPNPSHAPTGCLVTAAKMHVYFLRKEVTTRRLLQSRRPLMAMHKEVKKQLQAAVAKELRLAVVELIPSTQKDNDAAYHTTFLLKSKDAIALGHQLEKAVLSNQFNPLPGHPIHGLYMEEVFSCGAHAVGSVTDTGVAWLLPDPTGHPSLVPTATPTLLPTFAPTVAPTKLPTAAPTKLPTAGCSGYVKRSPPRQGQNRNSLPKITRLDRSNQRNTNMAAEAAACKSICTAASDCDSFIYRSHEGSSNWQGGARYGHHHCWFFGPPPSGWKLDPETTGL